MSDELRAIEQGQHADYQGSSCNSGSSTSSRESSRARPRIPTIEEALGQLAQLSGAVMLKLISSKDASLLQRILKTIIDVQLKRASQQDAGVNQEALAELCQRDPQLVNLITPFLSDAQIDWLQEQIRGDTSTKN